MSEDKPQDKVIIDSNGNLESLANEKSFLEKNNKKKIFPGFIIYLLISTLVLTLINIHYKKTPLRPEPVVLVPVEQIFGDNAMDQSPRSCIFHRAMVEEQAGREKDDLTESVRRRLEQITGDPAAFTRGSAPTRIADECNEELFKLGGAVADLDDDGFTELITFSNGGQSPVIWWNNSGRFKQTILNSVGERKSLGIPFIVDVDGDGDADIGFSPSKGLNEVWILINEGERKFNSQPVIIKVEELPGFVVTSTTGDLNGDGIADVAFSVRNAFDELKAGVVSHPVRVLMSTGDERIYQEITTTKMPGVLPVEAINTNASGVSITQKLRYMPFALTIADFDGDGKGDIFAAGDYGGSRIFFQNEDKFVDLTEQSGVIVSTTGMGAQVFDADGDGRVDILSVESDPEFSRCVYSRTCNMNKNPLTGNRLLINNGDRTFSEQAEKYGIARTGFGWTFSSTDLNGDGYQDIFVGNGELVNARGGESWQATFDRPYLMLGGEKGWEDYSGDILRNIRIPGIVTYLISADFDGDFRPDILLSGPGSHAPYLLLNRTKNGSWGGLQIRGLGKGGSPSFGEGSEVKIEIKNRKPQTLSLPSISSNYHTHGAGYAIPIGFGDEKKAKVTVKFPSGLIVTQIISPNQINRISER